MRFIQQTEKKTNNYLHQRERNNLVLLAINQEQHYRTVLTSNIL